MDEDFNLLKQMASSKNLGESTEAVDRLVKTVDEVTDILIEALKSSNDRFIISDRASLFFSNYVNKLKQCLNDPDTDLSFWAATLIVHCGLNDNKAEKLLADSILSPDLNKAYSATTILCRNKSLYLKPAILERMKDSSLTNQAKEFFKAKLEELQ